MSQGRRTEAPHGGRGVGRLRRWSRLWFRLVEPVDRSAYARHGFGLAAFKYAVDATAVWLFAGTLWTPAHYLSPLFYYRQPQMAEAPEWLLWAMVAWTLPFLWIGVSMTLRRAVDAGLSPWLCVLFFVPIANYLLMLGLCLAPGRGPGWRLTTVRPVMDERLRSALLGLALGVGVSVGMTLASVYLLRSYGSQLFLGTPLVVGAAAGWVHNRGHPRTLAETWVVVLLAVALGGGALLLFALEGAVCLFMAAPLAGGVAMLGAVLGRAIALHAPRDPTPIGVGCLALPLAVGLGPAGGTSPAYEVVSVVGVGAPPDVVWREVVGFAELPPPSSWAFRLGIAYPERATIEGSGVGAVRRCEFSTGPFVEPITVWDAPWRLAFDVVAQPPPLEEWSPYRRLHPPHLDGWFRSRRGEFRLVRRPDGGTRLEGRTWYELDLLPRAYWRLWSDALVRAIHRRVLVQIRIRAEAVVEARP